jgi:DNA polymerase beta
MVNENIIQWFKLLIKQLEFYVDVKTGKDKITHGYKLSSIKKSLGIIEGIGFEIKSGEQIKDYKNIGQGTVDRINEILKTGKLAEVNEADISGKHLDYVEKLMKVFGIGRVVAYELYTKHGIKSIDDLKKAVSEKRVKLPENVMKGIKYVDQIDTRIPRSEMDEIYLFLIKQSMLTNKEMHMRMCGSYRRGKEVSGDIDIIITHPEIITKSQAKVSNIMLRFIEQLKREKFIVDSFTSKKVQTKYMGICRYKNNPIRRIDIRFIAEESYYTALLYFTGSEQWNKKMRRVAKSMGYRLNEYWLLDENKQPLSVKSESDVFNYLNMEYMNPKDRN